MTSFHFDMNEIPHNVYLCVRVPPYRIFEQRDGYFAVLNQEKLLPFDDQGFSVIGRRIDGFGAFKKRWRI